jgi:hypothetical protein
MMLGVRLAVVATQGEADVICSMLHSEGITCADPRYVSDWSERRFLREDGTIGVVHRLKNGVPAHVLSRDDRAKGGRARAAKARGRRGSLFNERRGSKRLEEAAERLGQLLRSNNMETAMWADGVITQHILPEPTRHLPFPYMKRLYD